MLRQLEEVYYPESLEAALAKMREYGGAASPIAGGTDIVPDPPPGIRCLVDITRLGLDYIEETEEQIRIGATATMQKVAISPQVASLAGGLLSRATCDGWPLPVRNAATIGGNLASAGPWADTPPALLALDAVAVVVDKNGEKRIPLQDFFLDYRKTAIGTGLLKEIVIPKPGAATRGLFMKLGRTSVDQAMVNVGVLVEFDGSRCCRKVRIALGAVTGRPSRVKQVEELLVDRPLEETLIEKAVKLVTELVEPVLDFRASADYRREMSGVLLRRALRMLAQAS
ncbi:MAG: FAD binding domain-containing protein [Armatimonadetes bacterium]|nr:FAD binding domain-containing protein [Armatimonadota bacterium]